MSQGARALNIQKDVAKNIQKIQGDLAAINTSRDVLETALIPVCGSLSRLIDDIGGFVRALTPVAHAFSKVSEHLAKLITNNK